MQDKRKNRKPKEPFDFDKFMTKMDKEVSLLSKITDGVSKRSVNQADHYEKINKNHQETIESLNKEISFLKELNTKLEVKVESLLRQQNQQIEDIPISTNKASQDLKTLLSIVNLIGNNPGVMTIILQEFKAKLKLDESLQIYERIYDINLKLSSKPEPNSPFKQNNSASSKKKRASSEYKKSKIEGNLEVSRTLNDFQMNFQEIDKQLSEYNENISIQKLNNEGYYKIGNKKVVLQLVNGKLVVRIGGGFLQLKDFLEFYSIQEIKRSNQKKERLFNEKSI